MKTLLFLSAALISLLASAQVNDTLLARFISNLHTYYELNPAEKCLLHTDKSFYQPGETVWMKGHLMLNQAPSSLSNVVYTDLSTASGRLIHKAMWQAVNGSMNGSIYLPDTLTTGIYRIRAYSLWMLNTPATIAEQYIFVLGKKDQQKTYFVTETDLNVEFFPEGGQLVTGINNRIAFRIADRNMQPPSLLKAYLTDDGKTNIASPFVFQNGIGAIEFTPRSGKTYQLMVERNFNNRKSFQLPEVKETGTNFIVYNLSPSKLFVQLNTDAGFPQKNQWVYLLVQQNGVTVSLQKLNLQEAQNAVMINKKNLSTGLTQVVAFNDQLQPLAERWIWVQKPAGNKLTLSTDTLSFERKALNSFTLAFSGIDTPDLSVSVIPADLPVYDFVSHPTMIAANISHANHYQKPFILNNVPVENDTNYAAWLDALLTTLQPGLFNWDEIKSGKQKPLNYFFETGISLRGYVKKEDKMSFDSSKINFIITGGDSSSFFATAKADAKGAFAVNDLHFRKTGTVHAQAIHKDKKQKKIGLELLPAYIDTLSEKINASPLIANFVAYPAPQKGNEAFVKNYSVSGIGRELQEVVVTGKTRQQRYTDSINNAVSSDVFRDAEFMKVPDTNFNYISFAQLFEQEFLGFRFNNGYDRVAGLDGTASTGLASADFISYYLNEQPIDVSELNFINPADVILIKINRNANLSLGQMGPGPSILIYTKTKKYKSRFGFDALQLTGYSIPLQFHLPAYPIGDMATDDRRTTLLWQPSISFNSTGKAIIRFFNNDYTRKFKIVIQGIDKKGNVYFFEKLVE